MLHFIKLAEFRQRGLQGPDDRTLPSTVGKVGYAAQENT